MCGIAQTLVTSEESRLAVSLSREMELWHKPPMTAIRVLKFCRDLSFCSHTHMNTHTYTHTERGRMFYWLAVLIVAVFAMWVFMCVIVCTHCFLYICLLKYSGSLCKNSPFTGTWCQNDILIKLPTTHIMTHQLTSFLCVCTSLPVSSGMTACLYPHCKALRLLKGTA